MPPSNSKIFPLTTEVTFLQPHFWYLSKNIKAIEILGELLWVTQRSELSCLYVLKGRATTPDCWLFLFVCCLFVCLFPEFTQIRPAYIIVNVLEYRTMTAILIGTATLMAFFFTGQVGPLVEVFTCFTRWALILTVAPVPCSITILILQVDFTCSQREQDSA